MKFPETFHVFMFCKQSSSKTFQSKLKDNQTQSCHLVHSFSAILHFPKTLRMTCLTVCFAISNSNFHIKTLSKFALRLVFDAVMSGYCIQLTKLPMKVICFCSLLANSDNYYVMFKCVLEGNQNLSYCV
jgi:hypothetical protein